MFSRLFASRTTQTLKTTFNSFKFSNIGYRFQSNTAKLPKQPTGIKLLIQKYGNLALVVYLGLSLVDIPICFLIVHSAGEDVIREYQDKFMKFIGMKKDKVTDEIVYDSDGNVIPQENEQEEHKSSTLGTEFALAYALHKSIIFIRLPIAAAITPPIFTRLTTVGIFGYKYTPKVMKKAASAIKK